MDEWKKRVVDVFSFLIKKKKECPFQQATST